MAFFASASGRDAGDGDDVGQFAAGLGLGQLVDLVGRDGLVLGDGGVVLFRLFVLRLVVFGVSVSGGSSFSVFLSLPASVLMAPSALGSSRSSASPLSVSFFLGSFFGGIIGGSWSFSGRSIFSAEPLPPSWACLRLPLLQIQFLAVEPVPVVEQVEVAGALEQADAVLGFLGVGGEGVGGGVVGGHGRVVGISRRRRSSARVGATTWYSSRLQRGSWLFDESRCSTSRSAFS